VEEMETEINPFDEKMAVDFHLPAALLKFSN
jgi:hypothetical protein